MTADSALLPPFLLLVRQIKQLDQLLATKQQRLTNLITHRQQLDWLYAECERDIEAMITPSPAYRTSDNGEAPAFRALLRRGWALKTAHAKQTTAINRLRKRIKRLEKRIEASLVLRANAIAAISTGEGKLTLQNAIEIMLVKNQLWLGQYN